VVGVSQGIEGRCCRAAPARSAHENPEQRTPIQAIRLAPTCRRRPRRWNCCAPFGGVHALS
jgi:hypothetical protein